MATDRGDGPDRPRGGRLDRPGYRDGARGYPGRSGRVGDRRGLFRHAEVPRRPAGPGADLPRPPRDGSAEPPEDESPELVPRPDAAPALLGNRAVVSPHGADQHE